MTFNKNDLTRLENQYHKTNNQLVVLYGRMDTGKEDLIRAFIKDKKYFYYRCRETSAEDQLRMMGDELEQQFQLHLTRRDYSEYFNRIKSGGPSKLVIAIDEAQYVMKKDPSFITNILKLKAKKLYPGPVMIILASSSIVWTEQDLDELLGDDSKRIDERIKIEGFNFLEVVQNFPELSVSDCVRIYGCIGGVQGYLKLWNSKETFKQNVCRLMLSEDGVLFHRAQQVIAAELRELSVYNTILSAIARGYNKLNDLYLETGYSRAKISVYMKNLSHFDIIEKVVSFETSGWSNAKKGVYHIKDTFINFWYKFVFPYQSDLYMMSPEEFYTRHIADELDAYLNRYFRNVCLEYLMLLNQIGRTPFAIHKMGTWIGKTGTIDIIAQSSDRRNIVGFCNWDRPQMTMEMCEQMALAMDKAKLKSEHYYLFSATTFEPALYEYVKRDPSFELIDMNEL